MIKKIITVCTTICFIMFLSYPLALAKENTDIVVKDINGDMTYNEGAKDNVDTIEQKAIRLEKLMEVKNLANIKSDRYTILTVPVYQQLRTYWCGPATVKQVVQYINGSSGSQSYFASELGTTTSGTDMSVIDDCLCDETGKNYIYFSINGLSLNDYMSYIWYGMTNQMPAVLDIDTRNVSDFPYSTSGHFVNSSGYDTYATPDRLRITDPHYNYSGNTWYKSQAVYDANMDHWRQAIIY